MLMVDNSQTHMKAETFIWRLQLNPEIPVFTNPFMHYNKMVGYVADPALCEVLKEVRDQLVDIEIDEVFFIAVLQFLRSPKFPPKAKTGLFELVVEKIEKEIQYLNDQIQSYEF